jgi:hypothetical protein
MQEKETYVRMLLSRGLTVHQISGQLRCSESFVRRVRKEQEACAQPPIL